jgi:hypothetical protein
MAQARERGRIGKGDVVPTTWLVDVLFAPAYQVREIAT